MVWKVFIDGEVGTTGLQIRDRLDARGDIALVQVDHARRKELGARLDAMAESDVTIFCLPDAAVKEIVPEATGLDTRMIDASTAHRVDPDWAFGFPELDADLRARIEGARAVSNPGCYSTGAIALIAPLIGAGLIAPDTLLTINAVSGYTGGGKALIGEYEDGAAPDHFVYGLGQTHKHVPEIMVRTGLAARPVFSPSVGSFAQGMAVQVPLHVTPGTGLGQLHAALADHYADAGFVRVVEAGSYGSRVVPTALNGTNRMELSVHGDADSGCAVLIAVLDNLGKGASGAAVQNLNIMLGLDEAAGL